MQEPFTYGPRREETAEGRKGKCRRPLQPDRTGGGSAAGPLQPDRTGGDGAGLPETKEGGEETMRLTWGEYLDYEDPVWQERKAYLEEIRQRFSKEAAGFDTAELL